MTEQAIEAALREISETLGGVVRGQHDMGREIGELKTEVREVRRQTTATNGRVTGLETREAAQAAAQTALAEIRDDRAARRERLKDRAIGASVSAAMVALGAAIADWHPFI